MAIYNFLVANWDSVVVFIVFIGILIFLAKKGEIGILNQILFTLVTEAERQFGSGTGALKKATVVTWLYERLPAILKLFFSEKELGDLIEKALAAAKLQWASNKTLKEYIEGSEAEQTVTVITEEAKTKVAEEYAKTAEEALAEKKTDQATD